MTRAEQIVQAAEAYVAVTKTYVALRDDKGRYSEKFAAHVLERQAELKNICAAVALPPDEVVSAVDVGETAKYGTEFYADTGLVLPHTKDAGLFGNHSDEARQLAFNAWYIMRAKVIETTDRLTAALAAANARADMSERLSERVLSALRSSPDEMTMQCCLLVETLKEEMADKRELLHRMQTSEALTLNAQLLQSDQEVFRLTAALREREADSARFLWMQENPRRCFTEDGRWVVHHPSGDSRRARSFFAGPFDSLTEAVDYARDESRVFDYTARTTEGA